MKHPNAYVTPLFTDLYELTMAYAYFNSGKHEDGAVFELFFRRSPFNGEFAIFAGLTEGLKFLDRYRFADEDVEYVASLIPGCGQAFKDWLRGVDTSAVQVDALTEGTLAFPRVPLLTVSGPLAICQMLESALLNLVSYPSLVATNAARLRIAAGEDKTLVEFGLRRAQGPNGALSAARYSYLGGFDGTSNVLAAQLYSIPASGTQAHAYISAFTGLDDLDDHNIATRDGRRLDFVGRVLHYRNELNFGDGSEGELAAFIAYAQAFPKGFLALVDTYDTLQSGIPNFLAVALALTDTGYDPVGIRLDSGDLAHLSKRAREMFHETSKRFGLDFDGLTIVASNEINEPTLRSLAQQGHEIDVFGVGTNLVTCQAQPALGCVYKLVEINGAPRLKISQESMKSTIPGRKRAYRLIGQFNQPLVDLLVMHDEDPPRPGEKILCSHPFEETKRTYVVPSEVIPLHENVWNGAQTVASPTLDESRNRVREQLDRMREDHLRLLNPTPYKVSLSERLLNFTRELWRKEAPIGELR